MGAQEIVGNRKVSGVLLSDGVELAADAVVLSVGYHPNTNIAEKAGLNINENGFIIVDEYMRTDNPDIFAVGDCAEKRDFFTRKPTAVMLASTACAEAGALTAGAARGGERRSAANRKGTPTQTKSLGVASKIKP